MVRLRIDKKGFDKGVEDLRQALRKCTVSDGIRGWGALHDLERSSQLAGESEAVKALIHTMANIVSYSRERR